MGRYGDDGLAFVGPKFSEFLKNIGGGSINPYSGLPENWKLGGIFKNVGNAIRGAAGRARDYIKSGYGKARDYVEREGVGRTIGRVLGEGKDLADRYQEHGNMRGALGSKILDASRGRDDVYGHAANELGAGLLSGEGAKGIAKNVGRRALSRYGENHENSAISFADRVARNPSSWRESAMEEGTRYAMSKPAVRRKAASLRSIHQDIPEHLQGMYMDKIPVAAQKAMDYGCKKTTKPYLKRRTVEEIPTEYVSRRPAPRRGSYATSPL